MGSDPATERLHAGGLAVRWRPTRADPGVEKHLALGGSALADVHGAGNSRNHHPYTPAAAASLVLVVSVMSGARDRGIAEATSCDP